MNQIKNILLESNKSKIAIIGKGKSIKDVEIDSLSEFLIINLNDSEKIIEGDFSLFYRIDKYELIRNNGFKSKYYLAPSFLKIPDYKHIEVRHKALGQDNLEVVYEYLESPGFELVDFIVLSAIKFSILHQIYTKRKIEVYLLGFDFHTSEMKPEDYQMHDLEYTNVILKTQESYLTYILRNINKINENVSIHHIGNKSYSSFSSIEFNDYLEKTKEDSVRELTNSEMYHSLIEDVYNNNKTIIVAEFTNNHIGDKNRLVKMIHLAKESGADMIKLQKRDVDTFYTQEDLGKPYNSPFGKTLGDYRRGVELNHDLFELVDNECRRLNIPWFVSILDFNSYKFMLQYDVPILKLPSTISNHRNYLKNVGDDFKGDLVISTGFTDATYEDFVLENFTKGRKLFLLQCTSSYPTPPEACQISVVRHYDELKNKGFHNLLPGYSSHDVGSLGCMLSVAAGAKMIEKHVKLGDLDWVHFDGVAIDLYEGKFKQFVHDVRKAEVMCGKKRKQIHSQEHHKYKPNSKVN